ncbi:MAG TPA: TIGR00282 family metallophosphoesterase [Parvularculaceae bacterium]|nr:TIGR00282 family metallophosphoesterase [Parvularculaceae bacterium]
MRLAVFGDVVGRSGRTALIERLPPLRRELKLDFIVVNAENAAGGFGVTASIVEELLGAGADVLTTGNHAFDRRNELEIYDAEPRLLRPLNYPSANPGRGAGLYQAKNGCNVLVLHAQGQVEMSPNDDPFAAIDAAMAAAELGRDADAVIVDFHAEATSEKQAMGAFLDGRVSAVIGTHTHTPTADDRILPGGTAFISDVGMCGDYDSIIGMEKTEPLNRFLTKMPAQRFHPAAGEATLCGVLVETDAKTGFAVSIEPIRIGGRLKPTRA